MERLVAVARSARPDYSTETVGRLLRELFRLWGLEETGSLAALIPHGARVVVKPNWVRHYNASGAGLECLITHPAVIRAVLECLVPLRPSSVVVGDAPVQGCDFASLLAFGGIESMAGELAARGLDVRLTDFRRTVLEGGRREENRRALSGYVLFDLGRESLLEPVSADAERFRVTMYDPALLYRTHAPGRHQYLVAREVIEADAVINLPKLKTHKKACVTGALKNAVGVNGNKEYLPHHRKGGSADGGDCYPGRARLKGLAEDLFDRANRRAPGTLERLLRRGANLAVHRGGGDVEGSWYGNDTVWRTSLDLQRILHYGRSDGTLAGTRQRVVITITDAIVAGEGEGPMANTPVAAGLLTGALNTAAADWVHARLMGFDPRRIPLIREAFGDFPFPLAGFGPGDVRVRTENGEQGAEELEPAGPDFRPAAGWAGHCELAPAGCAMLPISQGGSI